jgi:hypothetical protein
MNTTYVELSPPSQHFSLPLRFGASALLVMMAIYEHQLRCLL